MFYALGDRVPLTAGDDYFVAPSATVLGSVKLGRNSSVWYGAVLRGDSDWIVVGDNSNIQDGSILHTDPGIVLEIGENVTVGHMVMLHGCRIGDNSLIGIGSRILNNARIGRNTLVGANALITEGKEIPDGVLVLGSPAKVVRELSNEEIGGLKRSAEHYVENARRHRETLTALGVPGDLQN